VVDIVLSLALAFFGVVLEKNLVVSLALLVGVNFEKNLVDIRFEKNLVDIVLEKNLVDIVLDIVLEILLALFGFFYIVHLLFFI
jgi:hypothetical protein